jgi:hypothetical protein
MVALDQSHAHQALPADIDTPPLSAKVPTPELCCLLVAYYEQTLQGVGSLPLLGEAWLWESALSPSPPKSRSPGKPSVPWDQPSKEALPLPAVAKHPVLIPGHLSASEGEELRNLAPLVRYFLIPTSLKAVSR